ncbi:DUF914-domain-containing protein [Neoconidiobolus thromboides FSU 785]|nr:DUF914-domain-containing protein [Neoconidiobolus thromboides FSU 785]
MVIFNKAAILLRIKDKKFWLAIALGQFLSLCISTTNITTGSMAQKYEMNIPATQSFVNYILLFIVYNTFLIYKYGIREYGSVLKNRGWIYLILALFDVEGNYFIVKGFGNTNYLSAMLINACSTPGVVVLSFLFLKTRYRWTHIVGVLFCLIGLIMLVLSDVLLDKDYPASNLLLGNIYCIIGALFYACSNTLQEFMVRKHPNYEIIAMIGLFGMIISGIQLGALERDEFVHANWNSGTIGLYCGFTIAMFCLYSLTPVLIGMTSATFFNISLLTSDFYGLILGLIFLTVSTHIMYPFAFICVLLGLIIYNVYPTHQKGEVLGGSKDENNEAIDKEIESDFDVHLKNKQDKNIEMV